MQFTKMEGLGNDYIYINCLNEFPEDLSALAVRLSDRHFGVGGDGLICIGPGREGDFSMHMFNADGSRGMMCGNGIRCVGKYVYDKKLTRKQCLTIDTDAGPRELRLEVRREQVVRVSVNMGRPEVSPPREVRLEGSSPCGGVLRGPGRHRPGTGRPSPGELPVLSGAGKRGVCDAAAA